MIQYIKFLMTYLFSTGKSRSFRSLFGRHSQSLAGDRVVATMEPSDFSLAWRTVSLRSLFLFCFSSKYNMNQKFSLLPSLHFFCAPRVASVLLRISSGLLRIFLYHPRTNKMAACLVHIGNHSNDEKKRMVTSWRPIRGFCMCLSFTALLTIVVTLCP